MNKSDFLISVSPLPNDLLVYSFWTSSSSAPVAIVASVGFVAQGETGVNVLQSGHVGAAVVTVEAQTALAPRRGGPEQRPNHRERKQDG